MAETFDESVYQMLISPFKLFHKEGDFSFITDDTLRESLTHDYNIFFNKLGNLGIRILKMNNKDFNDMFWKNIKKICYSNSTFYQTIFYLEFIAIYGFSEFTIIYSNLKK